MSSPKILSVVTVPTGGWTMKIYISISAQYDTAVTATIPAGDYFVAWDNQDDDFIWTLSGVMSTAIKTATSGSDNMLISIDSDHKCKLHFMGAAFEDSGGDNDVKIAWTEEDGDEIGAVLGFDVSADDTSTSTDFPTFESDHHHAYGWYADDFVLQEMDLADVDVANVMQSVAPSSGHAATHYIGSTHRSSMMLRLVKRSKMISGTVAAEGKGYAEDPVWPYAKNEPLQCWWREAREGKRFRVYPDGSSEATAKAADRGSATSNLDVGASPSITDTGKSFETDPDRWVGALAYSPSHYGNPNSDDNAPTRFYISSHDDTVLSFPAGNMDADSPAAGSPLYYLFDHQYGTYVLDLESMISFAPVQMPNIDRFDLEIPLLRYES